MKRTIAILAWFVLVAVLGSQPTAAAHTETQQSSENFASIDAYITSQMATYRIPGLALAIIHHDQIIYLQGYGVANPGGETVTPQTSFIIGSTGKSITATALMMLVDAGEVRLNDPVQTYLPWFRVADEEASKKITVRMLLNQTSGIPEGTGRAAQATTDESTGALEEQIRSFSTVRLNHVPGTAYEYANANYQIVGMVVQAVSGQLFQQFIQERIYAPLEMSNSYTSRELARQHGMASGYRYWFGWPLAAYNLPYTYRQFPAGWYICSAEDLAHYLLLHMNDGIYRGKTLVSLEGMAKLHQPVLGNYAMGWVVQGSLISHNGGMPDYGSGLYLDTATGYGVAVVFNANTGYFYSPAYVIAPSILRLLSGEKAYQPIPDAWYGIMLPALSGVLALQVGWMVLSAWLVKRWYKQAENRLRHLISRIVWITIPLILEIGLAVYILAILQAKGSTVLVAYIYQPDITLLGLISLLLAIGWGLVRTILCLRIYTRRASSAKPG